MNRPKNLKEITWVVDQVFRRCIERDDITGFRVQILDGLGVQIAVNMGEWSTANVISFCELETSSENVVGITLSHLFQDVVSYRRDKVESLPLG